MSEQPALDFSVDMTTQTVVIIRAFDADLALVWDAFTTADLLDQWVAPKPFSARTKEMDFKVGGRRLYAMVSPEGQERWILQTYLAISPKTHFRLFNAFCDADGNAEATGSDWDYTFSESGGKTTVRISIYNASRERLEKMLEFGFKEGYTASIANLDALLLSLSQQY